jgi:hypothetical protein
VWAETRDQVVLGPVEARSDMEDNMEVSACLR